MIEQLLFLPHSSTEELIQFLLHNFLEVDLAEQEKVEPAPLNQWLLLAHLLVLNKHP